MALGPSLEYVTISASSVAIQGSRGLEEHDHYCLRSGNKTGGDLEFVRSFETNLVGPFLQVLHAAPRVSKSTFSAESFAQLYELAC